MIYVIASGQITDTVGMDFHIQSVKIFIAIYTKCIEFKDIECYFIIFQQLKLL